MDNIGIKNEFFDFAIPCCHACLSTGRNISTVTEYVDIFYRICDNLNTTPPSKLLLCWECTALLKRVKMFRNKVAEAQQILHFYYTNKQDPFPNSLSNLTAHTSHNQIHLTHEENETKLIKEEIDYDDYDNFDYDNIKEEPLETNLPKADMEATKVLVPETSKSDRMEFNMKRILKRKAKYRFLNAKLKKHRRLLVTKIPMGLNEVLSGLEEERCLVSFVKEEHKCIHCVAMWSDEESFVKHNKKCHDEKIGPYSCDICRIRYPSFDKLETHASKHYYKRECKVCRLQSWSQNIMDRHLTDHDRMVQCVACELCFKNVRLFYSHYKTLHEIFVCDVCGKRCKSRSMIERHLRHHFGYECPYCKRKLKNSSSYKSHVETQHTSSVSDNSYCVQCDRRFTSDRMYKRHLQASAAHARERDNTRAKRKYPCPECSNVYSRRSYMNNHYRHVHSKQSKYYCEDCDRHFLNRTRYLDHRRFQHEGVKRDKDKLCNICGRGFAANRTLVNHIRTHSGERPFACEYCGAKFTQKHAMLSHVKYIHLKSKRKPSWHE